jgi:hypothetical protein
MNPLWHHPANPICLTTIPEHFFIPLELALQPKTQIPVLELYPQHLSVMLEFSGKNKSQSQVAQVPSLLKEKVYLPKLFSPALVTAKRDYISLAALEEAKKPLNLTLEFNVMDIDFFEFRNSLVTYVADRFYSMYMDGPDLPLLIEAAHNQEYGFLLYLLAGFLLYLALVYHRIKEEFALVVLDDDSDLLTAIDGTQYLWLFYYNLFFLSVLSKCTEINDILTRWHFFYFFCKLAMYAVLAIKFYTFPLKIGQAPFPYFIQRRADKLQAKHPSLGKITDYYCSFIAFCGLVSSLHAGLHLPAAQTGSPHC